MIRSVLYASLLSTSFMVSPALAEAPNTSGQCTKAYNQCQKSCDENNAATASDRITCITACSGTYAACDAGVALEKAKPWLEDQAKKTKKFLEDLLGSLPKNSPAPQKQDKSNSI